MKTAVSVSCMRASDQRTIESGTSGLELMHRAGEAIYHEIEWHGSIAILCGVGNNGGDGYVLASLLQKSGHKPHIVRIADRFSKEGWACYEEAISLGVADRLYLSGEDLTSYDIIVDCLLGTGFSGTPSGELASAIHSINASGAYIVSVDINSGLSGDNGQAELCVVSDHTVSVGTVKTGLLLGKARDVVKRLSNVDIGISIVEKEYKILEDEDVAVSLPMRLHNSHKGTYGYVTILGGCLNYSGAIKLSNLSCAAMRAGAGVCRLAVPEDIAPAIAPYLLESTLAPQPSSNGTMQFAENELNQLLSSSVAMAVGMGWGSGEENQKILSHLILNSKSPLLIDADGLNALAVIGSEILMQAKCRTVLTPHVREFSRISCYSDQEILKDPIHCAEEYARKYGVILLLKGATTIVTDGTDTYLSTTGCPGMATAGSGDVLSGVLLGLLGYLPCTSMTIASGAYITGLAGEMAEREVNPISMCASDTVRYLPSAIRHLLERKKT